MLRFKMVHNQSLPYGWLWATIILKWFAGQVTEARRKSDQDNLADKNDWSLQIKTNTTYNKDEEQSIDICDRHGLAIYMK